MMLRRISMLEVDGAPTSPGLYAWYVKPPVGVFDVDANDDASAALFLDTLHRYALLYEPPPIDLKGASSYGTRWVGELKADYVLATLGISLGDKGSAKIEAPNSNDEASVAPSLYAIAASASKRKLLASILQHIIPEFSTPLYIGISNDLKKRLIRHKQDFTRVSDYLRQRPEERDRAIKIARTFGHRAAAREVAMEDLEVWILELDKLRESDLSPADIREVTSSAEWFLHKMYSPILGRR
ncbi:hypothetical protein [Rhodococcus sp. RDE2]|uniref:hypothetical protein n=1 Tax=Rhodococcus sp. RDE2 TaxID=2885078 RepID=UPI001E448558|nr:hypothetical protein [Rhodococcus sp. RDE2]BDB59768.1 hypothetical protein RDE2_15620 [Rhodococcus sp. RDE2]